MVLLPDSINILPFLAIFGWRAASVFPEDLSKIAVASQTAGVADGGDRFAGLCQQAAGSLQAIGFYIVHRSDVQTVMEYPVTFPLTQVSRLCKL